MYNNQSTRIKVIFRNETKKFKKPETYEQLLQQTQKAFGQTLPHNFKFYYSDGEGDIISITCQEDLVEALESVPTLKLVVEQSSEAARMNLDPDISMRSSLNYGNPQFQMYNQQENEQMFRNSSSMKGELFFEEIKKNSVG